jgi:tetratricopeptide (TPR) repeat protein
MISTRWPRFAIIAVILAALAFATEGQADAQSATRRAQSHYRAGMKLFNLGRFAEAIKEFEQAYEIDPVPVHLFNIGQAHWKDGNLTQARFFFQRYLAEAPQGEKQRASAEDRVKQIDEQLAAQKPPPTQPPRHTEAPQPPPERPAIEPARAVPVMVSSQPERPEPDADRGGMRWAGYGLIGAGALALAGGGVYLLAGRGGCGDLPSGATCNSKRRSVVPGFVLLGAGVATGVTGTILLYRGRDTQVALSVSDDVLLVLRGSL